MSQTLESKESDITTQIAQLNQLADKISELREEKENFKQNRRERKQKNNAFGEVRAAIQSFEDKFNELQDGAALAAHLDVDVPQSEIEKTLDRCRSRLQTFQAKEYDDFEDVSEISSVRQEFEDLRDELDSHLSTLRANLQRGADSELDEVNTKKTVLRIPDIGTEADSEAVQEYKQKLNNISNGSIIDPDEFEDAKNNYNNVDIDIDTITGEYELSEEAGELLLSFLRNETVTLAEVDDGVMDELKKLEEFSERLTIQF